jgi:hypothetical protein
LYDLITYRSIDRLSVGTGLPTPVEDLPPLPQSPRASPPSPPLDPVREQDPEPVAQPETMAPKKPARDEDAEEQYGELQQAPAFRNTQLIFTLQARFTPSQGM